MSPINRISPAHEPQQQAEPPLIMLGPRADNVWRLFSERGATSDAAPELEPLAQTLAASRSMVLARLVTLRLMSANNPVRAPLTRATVSSAARALLAEEEIIDSIVSDSGLGISSGAIYCSTHLRLQLLRNIESNTSQNAPNIDRWELLISELIHYVQACAIYVQRVISSAAGCEIDSEELEQRLSNLMEDDKRLNAP